MCFILLVLNILLAPSGVQTTPAVHDPDEIILKIIKTGGIGGVHQEVLVFQSGRMLFSGGTTVRLDAKERDRLITLAKRLPGKTKRRRARTQGTIHDYPLWYWVWISDAGKEIETGFPVESKDSAVNEFVTAIKSHERKAPPQLKTP